MSFSALPGTITLGDRVKTLVRKDPTNRVYVYEVRRKGTNSSPSYYETVRTKTGVYPPKPGLDLGGFTRLYDALKRYNTWLHVPALNPVPPTTIGPSLDLTTYTVDGHRHGGGNAGG